MVNNKIIKVCGMRSANNIQQVEALPVDMIGFIFYNKSPRFVYEMPDYMPKQTRRVGVFVNEDKATIEMYVDRFGLHFVQLHGNESPEYCQSLQNSGLKIIKAFSIADARDLRHTEKYQNSCSLFLFDTKCEQYGGSGNQFDWSVLDAYTGKKPFLLSGGINSYSARALKELNHPYLAGFDLNSRFETKPAEKDISRLQNFLNELNDK